MKNGKFLISTFLFFICLFSACENKVIETIPAGLEDSKNLSYSKIEDVDFRNFSYSYGEYEFVLKNGEKPYGKVEDLMFRFRRIQYTDLTNDGENEAIIDLYAGYATTSATRIYIYTLEKKQPKKLWSFVSGVNSNGGLKDIYARENVLNVELFGNTKFDESNYEFVFPRIHKYPQTECCPTKFTRFNFRWNVIKFILIGKPELFDYDWKKETHENLFYRKETEK